MARTVKVAAKTDSGAETLIPLSKLKKSPRNARKTPHSSASIEAYAASIAAKGMLQNLVVELERNGEGEPTGFYFVTIGEGRRLAQLLRVKRKEIKKSEPIRCVIDTTNDPHEISLDENVTRESMHPADQFDAFKKLAEERGWSAEDIAARFGVTAQVVRQRLRLGAVSPRLMQVYRDGDLTLDQMMAFGLIEDHARQEAAYERLSYNRDPSMIRRLLTETNVPATDRRAVFVGAEAYTEAGGTILRDLFTEDRGGYFEDVALLNRLTTEKLEREASTLQDVEGWKWTQACLDYPHSHGLRRAYPQPVELSAEDEAAYEAAQAELDALSDQYADADELPEDVDARLRELETEMERIDAKRQAYDAADIARGGAFVVINHDGRLRIERGFVHAEDEAPEADDTDGVSDEVVDEDGVIHSVSDAEDEDAEDGEVDEGKPLSDSLVRDLTAHRTLGLRLALGEQPDIAFIAVTHALVAQTFYRGAEMSPLEVRLGSAALASHADGIEDTEAGQALAERHSRWAAQMPHDSADLWAFAVALDHDTRMALFAHCVALTVNAVKLPWERKPRVAATADALAAVLALDMTALWRPTVRSYLGRVTKARILDAVREGLSDEAADRIADMKKQPMAEAAEQLLAGTGWLPALMRTPLPQDQSGASAETSEAYPVAAE